MTIEVDLQVVSTCASIPSEAKFQRWAAAALHGREPTLLTIRVVDSQESADLNARFRSRPGPTNVLSFTADLPAEIDFPLLGDIVICAPLVIEEAEAQGKSSEAHWAHLVVHGVLHLLGFDHQSEPETGEMETREISLLASLGYPDPYR